MKLELTAYNPAGLSASAVNAAVSIVNDAPTSLAVVGTLDPPLFKFKPDKLGSIYVTSICVIIASIDVPAGKLVPVETPPTVMFVFIVLAIFEPIGNTEPVPSYTIVPSVWRSLG